MACPRLPPSPTGVIFFKGLASFHLVKNKFHLFTSHLPTLDRTWSRVAIFVRCYSGQFSAMDTWSLTPEDQTQTLPLKPGQVEEEDTGHRPGWSCSKGFSGVAFLTGTGTWSASNHSQLRASSSQFDKTIPWDIGTSCPDAGWGHMSMLKGLWISQTCHGAGLLSLP